MPQRRGESQNRNTELFRVKGHKKENISSRQYGQGQEEDVREMLKRRSGQEWSENKGIVCRLPPSYKPVFVLFLSGSFPEKFYWTQYGLQRSDGQR